MSVSISDIPLSTEKQIERRCNFGSINVIHEEKKMTLPLKKVEINGEIINQIAQVTQNQTFQNPYDENLEATYIFPLPGGAAVSKFVIKIDNKIIIGKVKERGEARQEYTKAIKEGKKAALLEQERDDIFTVQIGNIPPQKDILVSLTYSEKLPFFETGKTEIRLPLVFAPRYIAGDLLERNNVGKGVESDTNIVSDASRISPPRLAHGFDPKIDLSINVEILQNDNQGLVELSSTQHATITNIDDGRIKISLSKENELLDRDFVLKWRLTQPELKNYLIFHQDENGDIYGMLTIIPPKQDGFYGLSRDIIFVIDRSGSMAGLKMVSATKACSLLMNTLTPKDKFSIMAFDDSVDWFRPEKENAIDEFFLFANERGLEQGEKFLRGINDRGGTELDVAIEEAIRVIDKRIEKNNRIPIIVLLTDGQIGDESRVLKRIQTKVGESRIFTIGIDTTVNESFLKRLAVMGGGTSAFAVPGEQLEKALSMIAREIGEPVLVDINIKDENCGIIPNSLSPKKVPDLFTGRTVNVFFKAKNTGNLILTAKYNNGKNYHVTVNGNQVNINAISQLWAKTKIFDLEDQFRISQTNYDQESTKAEIKQNIIDIAVKHSILTKFTAFIAVDDSEVNNKNGELRHVTQPVLEPDQWSTNAPINQSPSSSPMSIMRTRSAQAPKMSKKMSSPSIMDNSSSLGGGLPVESAPCLKESASYDDIDNESGYLFDSQPNIQEVISQQAVSMPAKSFISHIVSKFSKDKSKLEINEDINKPVWEKLEILLKEFRVILEDIRNGKLTISSSFEHAKNEMIKILSVHDIGLELNLLQQFLRKDVLELIAALNTQEIKAENLADKVEVINDKVTNIIDEAKKFKYDPKPVEFWENSI